MGKIINKVTEQFNKARAKLNQPGYWLEMLSASLLVLAYMSDGEPQGALIGRLAFTLLWAGLVLSLLFSSIVAGSLAVSGESNSESQPNTTFDWCLDFACWGLIAALGWIITAIVFLIACVWRHLIALALKQVRARRVNIPDINPASGVETFQAQLSTLAQDIQLELHADGLLVPTSDYLLCDAGLALRHRDQTQADLRLLMFKRQHTPDGGRGPRELLFAISVVGCYWPGVFADVSVTDDPVTWPEEIGQEGEAK